MQGSDRRQSMKVRGGEYKKYVDGGRRGREESRLMSTREVVVKGISARIVREDTVDESKKQ